MKCDFGFLSLLIGKLDSIITLLNHILKENKKMTQQMDELIEAVNAENTIIDGAITLIEGFNARLDAINANLADVIVQLQAAQANTVALEEVNAEAVALHDEIEAKTIVLAGAVNNVLPVV